jgi:hypothetical protein
MLLSSHFSIVTGSGLNDRGSIPDFLNWKYPHCSLVPSFMKTGKLFHKLLAEDILSYAHDDAPYLTCFKLYSLGATFI